MAATAEPIDKILADLPAKFRGPGAAIAVVKDGELLGEKVWGFADLLQGIPMSTDTVLPICSISKQMTCGLLRDLQLNPTAAMAARADPPRKQLDDALDQLLGKDFVAKNGLTLEVLGNNQSGIRDYWALTVLWGARPETPFVIKEHGPQMMARINKSLHFETGTQYSYANTNFYVLGRIMEQVTGQTLEDLLQERIFAPAGMKTAFLCADSSKHPGPGVGYEGNEKLGFYPGINNIEWAGDAGIVASLSDMVAYEKFVDANRDNTSNWYGLTSQAQKFKDGKPSNYGYGLSRAKVGDVEIVGHGGALRGYRLNRVYSPENRVSVVALINEEHAMAGTVTDYIIGRVLGVADATDASVEYNPAMIGTFLDPESSLAVTMEKGADGKVMFGYHRAAAALTPTETNKALNKNISITLDGDVLEATIPADNRVIRATRVPVSKPDTDFSEFHGAYYCDEIESTFHCSGTDGMLYGSFDGFIGKGPIHLIRPLAEDVYALACPRAMDSSPPGDWTIVARRDATGKISSVTIGCWLARNLQFTKKQ